MPVASSPSGTRARAALLLPAITILLVGCTMQRTAPTSIPTEPLATVQLATPTSPPVPSLFILVAPGAADLRIAAQAELALQKLATGVDAEFVRQDSLPVGDPASIMLLVALSPDPGLQSWAESNPSVQTASLGIVGLQATPNLSLLAPEGIRYDQLGFALGYLAAMVTPEYRLGALALEASAEHLALARGFVAGGTYYCGLCRPVHPPYEAYPVLFQAPGGELASSGVKTFLVSPPPVSLADLGLNTGPDLAFLGPDDPFSDLAPSWIASADFEVSEGLEALWTQVQTGPGGMVLPLGIRIHRVDPARVSEGRLALAEALLEDLVEGRIDTGVDPLTGELR